MYGKALAALSTLFVVAGGLVAFEDRYAKERELQLVAARLDQKILSDRIHQVEGRLWKLEDKYGSGCAKAPSVVKAECQQLKQRLEGLKRDYAKQR